MSEIDTPNIFLLYNKLVDTENKIKQLSPEEQPDTFGIDVYDKTFHIENIIPQREFMIRLSLATNGLHVIFAECIMYGKFIYDLLTNETSHTENIYIAQYKIKSELYHKYLVSTGEDDSFTHYEFNKKYSCLPVKIYISKKIYLSIAEVLLEPSASVCFAQHNHGCDGIYVVMHPICHMHLLYNIDMNLFGDVEMKKYILPIVYNEYKTFVKLLDDNIPQHIVEVIYKTCLYFDRHEYFGTLLKKKFSPPIDIIYSAITNNKPQYIETLLKHKMNIDVLNANGLSPIEHAIDLITNNNKCSMTNNDKTPLYPNNRLLVLLNSCKYTRNPKWWDNINAYNFFEPTQNTEYDKCVYADIKINNPKTITGLNDCIIRNLIRHNMVTELIQFTKHNIKFMTIQQFINSIIEFNRPEILNYTENVFPITHELICVYFKFQMYEKILACKKHIDFERVFNYIFTEHDINGLVFIFEYFNDCALTSKIFSNGNTLLHLLCMNNNVETSTMCQQELYTIYKCFRILMNYCPQTLNIRNIDGNTPISMACKNNYLTELLINEKCDVTNVNCIGDTYLHTIIRYGTLDVLYKVIVCGVVRENNLITIVNRTHETPLLLACKLRKQELCNVLIDNGADTDTADHFGNTIYHYIGMYGLDKINIKYVANKKNLQNISTEDCIVKYVMNEIKSM